MVRSTRSTVDLGVILNQGAVTGGAGGTGRAGKRPVLGHLASAPPQNVVQSGRGFWAKGVEKYMVRGTHQTSPRVCV